MITLYHRFNNGIQLVKIKTAKHNTCVADISGNCKTEYLIEHSIAKSITVILLYHLYPGSASYAGKPVKSTVIFLWCGFVF